MSDREPHGRDLTHVDAQGRARMVDVTAKPATERRAVAHGVIRVRPETMRAIQQRRTPKGDPVEVARVAGILAAKRTAELIPLCHPIPLTYVDVEVEMADEGFVLTASVATTAPTGVEMEALVAVSVAALTLYDMCKAVDREMTITDIRLERKTGGMSGEFIRASDGRSA